MAACFAPSLPTVSTLTRAHADYWTGPGWCLDHGANAPAQTVDLAAPRCEAPASPHRIELTRPAWRELNLALFIGDRDGFMPTDTGYEPEACV